MWFKHTGDKTFKAIGIADVGGLIFAGRLKQSRVPHRVPQIVISPGDGKGPARWYECEGHPENPADWKGHDLVDREVIHGHSLQLGDINRDGHLDILLAEMAKWREKEPGLDNPEATAWIFYGDGQGNFTRKVIAVGHDWHETRLADLDGDGDLDLLNKPYTRDAPRVDVWLNQLGNKSPAALDQGPEGFLALPSKSYSANWNAFAFSLALPLLTWLAVRYFVPFYRRAGVLSSYEHLEYRFGLWARTYAVACYLLTQLARMGTIMYLLALAMIRIQIALDAWWQLAGIFSGGMLGLFLLGQMARRTTHATAAGAVALGLLAICWMSLSPAWTGPLAAYRSPFHSFLVTVVGTLTILGAGLLLGLLSSGRTAARSGDLQT